MTMKQIVQQASLEVLHQAQLEKGIQTALRIKRRIRESLGQASNGYARALRNLENATEHSEMELLRQPPTLAGLQNCERLVKGLQTAAVVQF